VTNEDREERVRAYRDKVTAKLQMSLQGHESLTRAQIESVIATLVDELVDIRNKVLLLASFIST
jgi:molecular chaperone DnaK (HSP70)